VLQAVGELVEQVEQLLDEAVRSLPPPIPKDEQHLLILLLLQSGQITVSSLPNATRASNFLLQSEHLNSYNGIMK